MNFINFCKKNRKYMLLFFDIILIILAYLFSMYILSDNIIETLATSKNQLIISSLIAIAVYEALLLCFNVYSNITRYENGKDYLVYAFLCMAGCVIISIVSFIFSIGIVNIKIHLLACILLIVAMISYRIIIRMILTKEDFISNKVTDGENSNAKNLLIIGAGSACREIIKAVRGNLKREYNIVGIIDDNKNKINYTISGVKILGDRNKIEEICKQHNVEIAFFTIVDIKSKDKKDILDRCQKAGVKIRVLPSTENIIKGKNIISNLRDIDIEDILYRDPIVLDNNNISKIINDKVVLVTGAGGSIGSELCRQISKYNPKKLVMLDIYENSLYDIQIELTELYDNIEAVICSVRDKKRLEQLFETYKPNIVFHAAAHKHVPLMESSPLEAIKNNIFGTYNVVNACDKYKADKFILISSDKAVNPTNIMGATKRFCEMIVQAKNNVSKTEYVAVRFGNVLESNGSVVPLFKKQIAKGGPVTVTDKRITRFFMTIPEAVQLVLQAITYANGGEIFVLDMGEPVKIYDLAENLIRLSGLEPNVDIMIDIIGLRPGEKLYEELLMSEEGLAKTAHEKIYVAKPLDITMDDIKEKLDLLTEAIKDEKEGSKKIKDVIAEIVPTYVNQKQE